ncbi:LysR family transcriptional regulator [Marinobacter bohaiensis]|uniref:LysR family transcriptional regulator n=1 Tax=Marinobacter bohaiensis TaxID=2201898 RepID=UPI000DAC7167|nr:LysR family transcriptional regulator [Marinobacter bohaiensis]
MANLRSLDLNLLVVLHALLDEQHVTRAARRLALSQPATSNALERCRHIFNDPLLERVAGEMRLTAKARSLQEPLSQALAAISAVVEAPEIKLSQIRQTVRLVMADQPGLTVITSLLSRLNSSAPLVNLALLPWHGSQDALHRLESGEADIAISTFSALPPKFHRITIGQQDYVVAMRAEHPASQAFNMEKWLAWPHVVVSGKGSVRGSLEEILAQQGQTRHVGAVVPSFTMVEPLIKASDMIATAPVNCLSAPESLAIFDPPIKVPGFSLHLAWHTRRDGDPVVQHVIKTLQGLFRAEGILQAPGYKHA